MKGKQSRPGRGRIAWFAAGLTLLALAVALITAGLLADHSPPQPDGDSNNDHTTRQTSDPSKTRTSADAHDDHPAGMKASTPTRLRIPAIDVDTTLMDLGLTDSDELEVPPLGKNAPAGWYERSPTPGEIGPALIVGHVDSASEGPAVFYRLGALERGDTASVTREDGSTAEFTIDDVTDYGKDSFPEYRVYGNTDRPEIRLITCGGDFDDDTGHYEDNIVVTGHLRNTR
ncbi:class F sortase [Brevibacterium renqingii]|uniref:class F sortase n=1 Tax=Brevibacterium renqingii TaxID=2776916 RepID=UPI0020A41C2A|nr:class F sortase [Brevibacterium renqingii]